MPVDATAVAKLKQACDQAADLHPNSCSHTVWHVIKQYLPDQPYMNANALMDHVQGQRRWRSVQASQVGELVRCGAVRCGAVRSSWSIPAPTRPRAGIRTHAAARPKRCAPAGALPARHVHLARRLGRCPQQGHQDHLGPLGQRCQVRERDLLATGGMIRRPTAPAGLRPSRRTLFIHSNRQPS